MHDEPFSGVPPYVPTAFPTAVGSEGMTLRDYFAARAFEQWVKAAIDGSIDDLSYETVAREAYKMADAMLAARRTPR